MKEPTPSNPPPQDDHPRRSFLAIGSIICGAVTGLVPLLIGAWAFLDPLTRVRRKPRKYQAADDPDGFIRITSLDALTLDGPPQRFPVIADRQDAWNYVPAQPVGSVYLQRIAEQEVVAFNTTCPHAGCSVSYERAAFHCPCHNSTFEVDGKKLNKPGKENPSPRDLDRLDVDAKRLAQGEIWVRFMNFYTGKPEKRAKT